MFAAGRSDDRATWSTVPAGEEERYLAPWPADVLPGVGPKVAGELARLNIRRVGEVAAMPVAVLMGLFGARGKGLRDLRRASIPGRSSRRSRRVRRNR